MTALRILFLKQISQERDDLQSLDNFKVLSFGCGPCTDLFAIDYLHTQGIISFNKLEYRGIDYCKDVWENIHKDIEKFNNNTMSIKFFYHDLCEFINIISKNNWIPNLIFFQYVFSDMKKHTGDNNTTRFITDFAAFFNTKAKFGTYIIINDINLACSYGGGRDYFDYLNNLIKVKKYTTGQFNGYNYGTMYANKENLFPNLLSKMSTFNPFDDCGSAQMIIKKE